MDIALFVLVGLAVIAGVYAVTLYNGLVAVKHNVDKAWANIDVLLKQRHDELPKLVETCRQYAQFEQETLQRVISARQAVAVAQSAGDVGALGQAETSLRAGLGRLFAIAEAYPELRTNETFQHLQRRISELEDNIADRREFYNECVNVNNVRIEQFPDALIASRAGARRREVLQIAPAETRDVDIRALFR